ncbi:hypothetical protein [Sphaerisporangium perillae]|uniref:hypothetical protein n=1 Tax=Sphaerisporangium perillae TaxID=2935860 RepID=UPI00200D09C6|nr:hypothetical protein [Sphaerisporangium perillae]
MASPSWSWDQINKELAGLSPQQADCALAWLADHDAESVTAAVLYAKEACR